MNHRRLRRQDCWPLVLGLFLIPATGCAFPVGPRMTLFPERSYLLPAARELREGSPPDVPRELARTVLPPYVVEPGDVLLVQPADLDSPIRLPGDQPVLPDGTINLGRYGHLQVAGLTVEQIEAGIRALVEARDGRPPGPLTVRIVTRASKVYYVLGEVNAPGAFNLTGRECALDGILAAGGLTDRASRRDIILCRPTPPGAPPVVLPVCYLQIVQLGDTTTNYQLQPGDRIYVPTRTFTEELFGCHHKGSPCHAGHHPKRSRSWWLGKK